MSAFAKKLTKAPFLVSWRRSFRSLLFDPIRFEPNSCQHESWTWWHLNWRDVFLINITMFKVSRFSPVSGVKLETWAVREALLKTLNGSVLHYTSFVRTREYEPGFFGRHKKGKICMFETCINGAMTRAWCRLLSLDCAARHKTDGAPHCPTMNHTPGLSF